MYELTALCCDHLPAEKPRYLMGVGTPWNILECISLGVDMFDCVLPTREARHGIAYTPNGRLNIKNARFRKDARPLSDELDNYTCRNFTRAYIRHLFTAGEMLAATLISLNNIHFFLNLFEQVRFHIEAGDFGDWSEQWIMKYEEGTKANAAGAS